MAEVQLKTAVNTRAPLSTRLPKKDTSAVPTSGSLHRTVETTYDASYFGHPVRAALADGRSTAPSLHIGRQTLLEAAADEDDPESLVRKPCQTYRVTAHPPSQWETTSRAASRNVQPVQQNDFFASARIIERHDDDRRGGLVGRSQRTMDIRTKRAEDASLHPAEPVYAKIEPLGRPAAIAIEKYGAKGNLLDLVECTHLKPPTEQQIGYDSAPVTRLPGMDLSQDFTTQHKALSNMGTSRDLFRATPKYVEDKTVGYGGHIPAADRNIAAIHHGDDPRRLFSKSNMTLAEHGGGADTAITGRSTATWRRRGRHAPPPKVLDPRSEEEISKTYEGRALLCPLRETLERERKLNIRDDAQSKNYF